MSHDLSSEARLALTTTWAAQGISATDVAPPDTRATLRRANVSSALAGSSSPALPALLAPLEDGVPQIQIGATLGEGGMGVVYTAVQTSLTRDVAVKLLREADVGAHLEAQLLREARVTGALEHPNVVPIHALGRDAAGRPLIVMKRIEGRPWSQLLVVPDATRRSEAFLRLQLGILGQVARALHFAHTRRLLHRDLKPDNVMIGGFGEVYLVDWGIAVSLDPTPDGVPLARDVRSVEGTPVYLAPEMAAGDGLSIDARSDVYLLGSTLHEILTGQAPHAGPHMHAVLVSAYLSEPAEYAAWVPTELASIARCARAREPGDRYPSALAFAEALEEYLVHRGSTQLSREAERRARELAVVAESATREPLDAATRALFHEARFAFDQALESWPDNTDAIAGRRALLTSMIRIELARGTPGAAVAILQTLDAPPAELADEVERRDRAERERIARLQAMERDADMALGARARQALTYLGAASWGASCLACGLTTRTGVLVIDHGGFALVNAGFLLGTIVMMLTTRRQTLANAASRRVAYTTTLVFGAGTILWPMLGAFGLSMPETTMVGAFVSSLLWTTATFTLGVPWLPMVIGQCLVVPAVWLWPEWHFEIFGVIGAAQTALAARLMAPRTIRA